MKSYLFRDDLLQNETRKSMNQNFPSHDLARSETYTYLAAGSLAAGSQETPLIDNDCSLTSFSFRISSTEQAKSKLYFCPSRTESRRTIKKKKPPHVEPTADGGKNK